MAKKSKKAKSRGGAKRRVAKPAQRSSGSRTIGTMSKTDAKRTKKKKKKKKKKKVATVVTKAHSAKSSAKTRGSKSKAKTAKDRRPTTPKSANARASTPPRGDSRENARLRTAIRRLEEAQSKAAARAVDVLALVDTIANSAITDRELRIARSLCSNELLSHLAELHTAITKVPSDSLPEQISCHRRFPEAILNWLADELGIEREYEIGEERDISSTSLDRFDCDDATAPRDDRLVRIRILSHAWSQHGKPLAQARAELVTRESWQ